MTRAEIVVDVAAIRHNVARLREHVGTEVMAIVKADGYGHGMEAAARAAQAGGATWLGVASVDEALALRAAGIGGPILCWLLSPDDDLRAAIEADVDLTAYSIAHIDAIAQAAAGRPIPARVQLKVDTGLSRGGATKEDWPSVVGRARVAEQDGQLRVTGIWSHFATSEDPSASSNRAQEQAFAQALEVADASGLAPDVRHIANSAGALLRPSSRYDLVRCGIAIYGLDPAPGAEGSPWPGLGLVPAMTVRAKLAMSKRIARGAAVGYGGTWTAPAATTLGLVPIGYAEGVLRAAANKAEVFVDGRRRPVRGAISMDQFTIDLDGSLPAAGTEVVLWGPGTRGEPTAEEWAQWCGTISYEIVTRLGGRFGRVYVDSDAVEPEPELESATNP